MPYGARPGIRRERIALATAWARLRTPRRAQAWVT